MARTRILRQELSRHQAEIQRHTLLFVDRQLRFNQRGQLLANFVELFEFEVCRQLAGDFFIAQRHLFIAHIQQTVGASVGQRPRSIEVGLHRLTQTLGENAVFIHIDGGTDKFMYVTIVTDPQVDSLLAPADDTVELALQVEHQTVDKVQIVARDGSVLDTQQVGLQLIARRIQGILQFAQGAGGFGQQQFAARNRRAPVFVQQLGDIVFHLLLLLIHDALSQIDTIEDFRHRIFQRRKNVAMPVEFIATLIRGICSPLQFAGHNRQLHRQTQGGKFTLANVVIGNADT